jgi:hypothetical protein
MKGMQALFAAFAGLAASMSAAATAASDFGRAYQHGKRRRRNKAKFELRMLRERAVEARRGFSPQGDVKLAKKAAKGRLGLIHFGGSRPVGIPGKYAFGTKRTTPALSQPMTKPMSHRQIKKHEKAVRAQNKALKAASVEVAAAQQP